MNELLTTTPNAADREVQFSDEYFEIAIGPSGIVSPNREPIHNEARGEPVTTLTDSQEAAWVAETFRPTVCISSAAGDPESGGLFVSERVAAFLRQMRNDLAELREPVRSSPGAELCYRFTESVGMALAFVPQARCAVFGDEEDGVELVAHSRASKRQVSFEFPHEGDMIKIVSIDEDMRRSERKCRIDHARTLGEAIAWLNPR